eukprot:TRINITY_DN18201_c0_g1_i1.p1 TRINITY_DN18201_c0_g1~~TRINITY_DN18201_c0_g1_i1.p1  ORF type:complete len:395 (+),score=107.30 TRINITY_DN18201_c0_g1_i1:89-1186(+)
MAGARVVLSEDVERSVAGCIDAHEKTSLLDSFICSVCHNHSFGDPVQTPCEHLFHKRCANKWFEENAVCPKCRQDLPPGEDRLKPVALFVRSALDGAEVKCPLGCGTVCKFDLLRAHVNNDCKKAPLRCGNDGCEQVRTRDRMDAHAGVCEDAIVPCDLCKKDFKRGVLQEHKREECTHRPRDCERCGAKGIVHCEMDAHMAKCSGGAKMSDIAELKQLIVQLQEDKMQLRDQVIKLTTDTALTTADRLTQLQRTVLGYAMGVPAHVKVTSTERPNAAGTYVLLSERCNGAPVWGHEGHRVYRTPDQVWAIALDPDSMLQTKANLQNIRLMGKSVPFASEGWQANTGPADKRWQAAPGTSVTAAL